MGMVTFDATRQERALAYIEAADALMRGQALPASFSDSDWQDPLWHKALIHSINVHREGVAPLKAKADKYDTLMEVFRAVGGAVAGAIEKEKAR